MMFVEVTLHKISPVGRFYLQDTLGLVYTGMYNIGARVAKLAT